MNSTLDMLKSLENLTTMSSTSGGKSTKSTRNVSKRSNFRRVLSNAIGRNKTSASKQANYVPRAQPKYRPMAQIPEDKSLNDITSALQNIGISVKSAVKKSKPVVKRQRPVKMQQDVSDDDFLANLMSKASTSISQKSRTAYNKKVKASRSRVEQKQREIQRKATATRSSSRISKAPQRLKANAPLKHKPRAK